ncbi:MAG: hypothetical protein PHC28_13295 [Flavobacterium sp.]|uniref:hypothetical protein n=1 Tax=Flavobacterium sp. TaxID=239 RepID=UPI002629EF8F|nr:hypothetical protein [Flavobacterium sp.]MDD5151427.1 hypothetical protein [Flavobacterium sp.]
MKKIIFGVFVVLSFFLVAFIAYSYGVSTLDSSREDSFVSVDTISDFSILEKNRVNSEITAKNKNYRNNWFNYISVDDKFSYYGIGGIEDLRVIATNKTDYLINEVTVRLCYVIDNGSCYKNEDVTVYNIPPNSSRSVDAPSSSRGKNVGLEIIGIYSDKMNFLFTPDILTSGIDDPYFKK